MQGDAIRKRQPSAVEPVSHDRAAAGGELGPDLMPAAREWLELHERHLAAAGEHPGPDAGLGGLAAGIGPRGGGDPRSAAPRPHEQVGPLDPFAERCRKAALDHGDVGLLDGSLAKLPRQFRGGSGRLREHHDARHGTVEPGDDADERLSLAAALAGSLGIAPTGNIDPERRYPSMFEPIHGSAFDIMGQGLANPVGTFWSCVMLLEHLGEGAAAQRLMRAIEAVTADPALHTRDLGGTATTAQVTAAVCQRLQSV